MNRSDIFIMIEASIEGVNKMKRPLSSMNEGYAVLKKELDNLWELVKILDEHNANRFVMYKAIEIAVAAITFIEQLCDNKKNII